MVHGHYTVNGRKVDIPSYLVKPGDMVAIKDGSPLQREVQGCAGVQRLPSRAQVAGRGRRQCQAKIVELPTREEIDLEVDETLIVELYSK